MGEEFHLLLEQDPSRLVMNSEDCFCLRQTISKLIELEYVCYLPTPESPTNPTVLVEGQVKLAKALTSE